MSYAELIARKLSLVPPTGLPSAEHLHAGMFPHQEALVTWALRRGRCAIFADTGLGKTRMELSWANVAIEMGRRFVGIELKRSYYEQAKQNLRNATAQSSLFIVS